MQLFDADDAGDHAMALSIMRVSQSEKSKPVEKMMSILRARSEGSRAW